MAVPKKRTGASAQGHRRANWKATIPTTTACTNCNALVLAHTVCPGCGYYKKSAVSIKNPNYVALDATKKKVVKKAPKPAAPKAKKIEKPVEEAASAVEEVAAVEEVKVEETAAVEEAVVEEVVEAPATEVVEETPTAEETVEAPVAEASAGEIPAEEKTEE